MMMPKGDLKRARPRNTPSKDKITDVRIIKGWATELKRDTRMRNIKNTTTTNVLERNASDSFWNSNSPVN
jgi:hypothetical protein